MKNCLLLFLSILFSITVSSQTFETINGEKVNVVDASNYKQGQWIVKYNSGKTKEEGLYKDGRKVGLWTMYYPAGELKSQITLVGGRPNGPYRLYYENGTLQEEGTWANTKNTGDFKRYHPNGKIQQDFSFKPSGRRQGTQNYYYDNGQLQLTGSWNDGQESGEVKEYYENGDIMSIRKFNNGTMDKNSYAEYAPKTPMKSPLDQQISDAPSVNVKAGSGDKSNDGRFDGNGYYKLYNPNMQISKDGEFKNYRFIEGKVYDYDSNGLVVRIKIFKKGRYIGDGVITDK